MKLTVLIDNNASSDSCLIAEHGLSFLIEDNGTTLLFDCGSTDAFIKNAYNMQIDMTKITDIVLSHSHSDHIGGFARLQALYEKFKSNGVEFDPKRLIAHPDLFKPEEGEFFNSSKLIPNLDNINEFFNVLLSTDGKFITKKLVYIGEIPFRYGKKSRDYAKDETALAYKSKNGLVIFSGCSHSGVRNIVEQARYVTGVQKVESIVGGFYLINKSEDEINALGKYISEQGIKHIYPCHCTDAEAKAILSNYTKIEDIGTGKVFEWV